LNIFLFNISLYKLKRSKTKISIVKCVENTCKFVQTCEWNKRCMQEGLNLSIANKKTFIPTKKSGQKQKE